MIDSESYPIIVLGVERSGTSVVAEMLHRWGAYAGPPEKLHKADAHAPRGYWEFLPLWDLLAELGDFDTGATWWDKDFQRLPLGYLEYLNVQEALLKAWRKLEASART